MEKAKVAVVYLDIGKLLLGYFVGFFTNKGKVIRCGKGDRSWIVGWSPFVDSNDLHGRLYGDGRCIRSP